MNKVNRAYTWQDVTETVKKGVQSVSSRGFSKRYRVVVARSDYVRMESGGENSETT